MRTHTDIRFCLGVCVCLHNKKETLHKFVRCLCQCGGQMHKMNIKLKLKTNLLPSRTSSGIHLKAKRGSESGGEGGIYGATSGLAFVLPVPCASVSRNFRFFRFLAKVAPMKFCECLRLCQIRTHTHSPHGAEPASSASPIVLHDACAVCACNCPKTVLVIEREQRRRRRQQRNKGSAGLAMHGPMLMKSLPSRQKLYPNRVAASTWHA